MKTFNDFYNALKDGLNNLLTADNTEAVTNLVNSLDGIKDLHKSQEEEMTNLKNKMVDIVRNTTFAKQPEDVIEEKSIDDIMNDELNKIISQRK